LNESLWCSLDERAIGRQTLLNAYELAEAQFLTNAVRSGDLTIDAGANIGYHALYLAQHVGNIEADGGRRIRREVRSTAFARQALRGTRFENPNAVGLCGAFTDNRYRENR
jgi:hypothetical protein